jgi:hypothetical protein
VENIGKNNKMLNDFLNRASMYGYAMQVSGKTVLRLLYGIGGIEKIKL